MKSITFLSFSSRYCPPLWGILSSPFVIYYQYERFCGNDFSRDYCITHIECYKKKWYVPTFMKVIYYKIKFNKEFLKILLNGTIVLMILQTNDYRFSVSLLRFRGGHWFSRKRLHGGPQFNLFYTIATVPLNNKGWFSIFFLNENVYFICTRRHHLFFMCGHGGLVRIYYLYLCRCKCRDINLALISWCCCVLL